MKLSLVEIREWLPYLGAGSMFGFMCLLTRGYMRERFSENKVIRRYRELAGLVKERGKTSRWYHSSWEWLCKNGAAFHYGKGIQPVSYMTLRVILALTGLVILGSVSLGYGVLAVWLFFGLPAWLLTYLNAQDNRRMLPEIRMVYHALEIQLRAGVYVTDALAECYGSVKEQRLKQALLDLAGDIVMKSDIYQALERFQGKFNNRYIDALCITILQALESGQAVELLKDISEQIKDMEKTLLERQKAALERSITFYQLGILAVVLGVALYATISQLLSGNLLLF